MHFHKHIKQASLDAPSHHPAHGNRRHDQLPHRGRRRRDRRPRPPVAVLTRRHVGDEQPCRVVHTGVGKPRRHHRHRTTTVFSTLCASSRTGSRPSLPRLQGARWRGPSAHQRRRATTPSVDAALHTSRARLGEVPCLRFPLCVRSAAALRAASATHLQRKREHPSPAGDHKHPTAIRRQPYLDVEESKSDFAAGRGLRQLVLDD